MHPHDTFHADDTAAGDSLAQPSKTRSLSDGAGPQLSPSPFIVEAHRRTSKDDTSLASKPRDMAAPVTPRRQGFPIASGLNLALHMPSQDGQSAAMAGISPYAKPTLTPTPLSPKLDHSQIYASPTNILPRRSRGLDFSRAATSLHHSTLAEQTSPDTSPTISGRAMNIPGRGSYDGGEQSSNSLWSMMGTQERMNISSSVGSTSMFASGSSSSSDEGDFMDDEMEDAIMSTPQQLPRNSSHIGVQTPTQPNHVIPWAPETSPAITSLSSFRTRPRRQPKKKLRGLLGLGFNSASPAALSRSPPSNLAKETRDMPISHSRRESISWAANQLHISSNDNDDRGMDEGMPTPSKDGQRGVIRRAVTRRGNLLPKTKGFARIRAALAEESTPVDAELHREAEVIRQVRESDVNLEPRMHAGHPPPLDLANLPSTVQSSPDLNATSGGLDDMPEMEMESIPGPVRNLRHHPYRMSRGRKPSEALSDASSAAGIRTTPPHIPFLPRESSSGMSEDINMDSPSQSVQQDPQLLQQQQQAGMPPTAAEITRRINNKRRRDDDFDPMSMKRRAVSPGMSTHNSPVGQSPMQRDGASWGSRQGSTAGGDKASATPSENGASTPASNGVGGSGGGGGGASSTTATAGPFATGAGTAGSGSRPVSGAGKGRVGLQGMTDTHDSLMRMSIE
ncbi:uncharacterized protein B0I36DRAFT_357662 [Microdochium trichocladiopsis]|uniref:Uncharacterized protein n=1 Tax=Microdochium trichocladiopsis TaxID=1682393 RepID=A0A9P8YJ61_9PEZI|nr:uncharacterized protein B0I36DRAFT_357662 [Microdochium trichocladiopsis]KAH7040351.1 hypothetical protein B0I36DRAFT_357662 [Microdochium trichocladiopsis]